MFRVFLSYKYTNNDGLKSKDAEMAEALYFELKKRGIDAFYSNHTLSILGESKYKMAIDDALDESSLLVVVGTSAENINSNWVRYEWDSFYNDILSGRKEGQMISYIDGINAHDLPRTLRQLQSFELSDGSIERICSFISNYLDTHSFDDVETSKLKIVNLMDLQIHGISAVDAEIAFSSNDKYLYKDIPDEVAGTAEQWASIIEKFPEFTSIVVDENYRIFGNYTLMGLTSEEEDKMKNGRLKDIELNSKTTDNIYLPGRHIGYLLNLSVNPSSESAETYKALWQDLIDMLKKKANEENVFFSRIYYKAFLPEHEAKVVARGFTFCCKDTYYGNVYVHDMNPDSTLFALDQELAEIYSKADYENKRNNAQLQEIDALTAYMDLWKQLEEIFYQPEYCRLKKYFMGGYGIPQNTIEYKIGLALSEWIRDNLQYSELLLPFLPVEQQKTHKHFKDKIYSSEIVIDSIKTYPFLNERLRDEGVETEFSVASLITFARILLDIDRLFMLPDLVEYKQYFYENSQKLPSEDDLEICEMLTVRILSALRICEDQLKYLPIQFAEGYFQYKQQICSSEISRLVFRKNSFLEREIRST